MKACSKCGIEKPLDDFYAHSGCRDGYRPECKDCWRMKVAARRAAKLELIRERDRQRYANNPERRAAQIATARAHYAANTAHHAARKKEYYRENPGVYERAAAKRRALEMGVEHQPYTRHEIYDRDGGCCKGCQVELLFKPHGFEIDHIIPISLGGPDTPANVQLMCRACNRKKWNRLEGQLHFAA